MAKDIKTAKELKKKKKWVSILAGREFNNKEIGETYVDEAESAVGKTVTINLMSLTGDPKRQNFNVKFKIREAKNNQLHADLVGYFLQVAQKKRLSKKNKDKLEDSFEYKTKDNVHVVIKPVFTTKAMTYKSRHALIRNQSRKFIEDALKTINFSSLMREIIDGNFQREVKNAVKKFYPVNSVLVKSAGMKE
ncbi:MAG TPA: hypothetical protein VJG30_04080 [Candidatus Nanoarchaeia archaeon]|nr:hypothetical protein [Candidatus Nanoarchaeia archaeon]